MAALTTTDSCSTNSSSDNQEILIDIFGNNDDIAVEISPVEGYSEIKMLSSPFGAAMMSPGGSSNGGGASATNNYCISPSSANNYEAAAAVNDDIPQWKRDLIQRRKTNIVRTIGANQSVTCTKIGSHETLDSTQQQQQQQTPLNSPSPVMTLNKIQTPPSSVNNSTDNDEFSFDKTLSNSNSNSNTSISPDNSNDEQNSINSGSKISDDDFNNKAIAQPAKTYIKHTITVQHQQKFNQHQQKYDKNYHNDDNVSGDIDDDYVDVIDDAEDYCIDDDNVDDVDNDDNDGCTETGNNSGGHYTINNSSDSNGKNSSGNTNTLDSLILAQQQQSSQNITATINSNTTQQLQPPIPKLRSSLNQNNNSTTTNEINILTSKQPHNNDIASTISTTTTKNVQQSISNISLLSPTNSSNYLSYHSSIGDIIIDDCELSKNCSSSNQLHSKPETVKSVNIYDKIIVAPNEVLKTVDIINNLSSNKLCGNQNFIKKPINNNINNKYIKNSNQKFIKNNNIIQNKKMVSAQDINESSLIQTTKNHHHHNQSSTILLDDNDSTSSTFNDFDQSEELQYGPGIVSKLRVRYLSLALRQTTGKQNSHIDNLRRATSLNNLLDGGGSTGSTNDGSIIDGDTDNESNLNCHYNQQINNHHNHHHIINNHHQNNQQQQHQQQQQHKILKNVSWLNNQQNVLKSLIKEQDYLDSTIEIDGEENQENLTEEFNNEKNSEFLYEINSNKKPENLHKTGINNYQYIKNQNQQQQQQQLQQQQLYEQQQKQRNGRQVKRGNDSLKRARSVEALLCEKSSWINNKNNSNGVGKMSVSSGGEMLLVTEKPESNEINLIGDRHIRNYQKSGICKATMARSGGDCSVSSGVVTIEDKICNARERLHLSEKHPPKRLTSIIDDTERPPPDLVKQTLKLFEATANRRGARGLSRNTNSQVAVKIANYKSIISQEKPPIVYPKPPLSPKRNVSGVMILKKPNSLDIKSKTSTLTTTSTGNLKKMNSPVSPVSNLTKKFTNIEQQSHENDFNKFKTQSPSTPTNNLQQQAPQISPRNQQQRNNDNITPPSRTPDLIPRKHFDNIITQTNNSSPIDSPVTVLTKQIERLKITNSVKLNDEIVDKDHGNNDYDDDDDDDDDDETDECSGDSIKRVSKSALENISKASTTQHFSFNSNNNSNLNKISSKKSNEQLNPILPAKQIGIIRPLLVEPKLINETSSTSSSTTSITTTTQTGATSTSNGLLDNNSVVKPQRENLVISDLSQNLIKNKFNSNTSTPKLSKFNSIEIGVSGSVTGIDKPALTTREIEKNLINEKKNELANLEDVTSVSSSSSPLWHQQLTKKNKTSTIGGGGLPIEAQNNIMVFNFQDRKDVPDYIENDGLLIKRRRELPKSNESGYVLLGDLSLETSTDSDESWTMGPPSPCNVEFENANIIIDGKSNLRFRSKEVSLRVQFDDTLTSTFEYPSESSLLLDDSTSSIPTFESLSQTIDSIQHIDADEIFEIPISNSASSVAVATATASIAAAPSLPTTNQKSLGNKSLGCSAPLGSYTPIKAQIQTNFELGITRLSNNQQNGGFNEDQQEQNGFKNSTTKLNDNDNDNINSTINDCESDNLIDTENLQYLKPVTDDLTVVYSEGTKKTDLLY